MIETGIPDLSPGRTYSGDSRLQLVCCPEGVEVQLHQPQLKFLHSFLTGPGASRAGQPGQAIVKACNNKAKNINHLLDLTGGWGFDSFTLACHGQRVTLIEQNPLVYSIVDYAFRCFKSLRGPDEIKLETKHDDASDFLNRLPDDHDFDCIYLDPMFPTHKSGAKPGKEMQILQQITENHAIEDCFDLALQHARSRVVVKRPLKAPGLGTVKPDMSYREKTVRFDVFLTH